MQKDKDSARSYGNFRNPIGLVFRMLSSGSRAAWSALFREGLSIGAKPFDALMSGRERRRIASASPNNMPLVLIVGPPRSGTTLMYQVLAHCLDVSFPTNLSAMFPKSTLTMNGASKKPSADFQSFFGQTARMNGPNDAFHIWNRWLGDDRYRTRVDLSDAESNEMRQFFAAWTAKYDKPFLNKNNRNVNAVPYLAKQLPNVYFIAVLRDPVCVARSLIHARQVVQGDRRVGWGLQCQEDHGQEKPLGYVQDVCDQVRRNELDLVNSLEALDTGRVVRIQYESFCRQPDECIDRMIDMVPGLKRRPDARRLGANAFQVSTSQPLSPTIEQMIQASFAPPVVVAAGMS